MVGGAGGKIGFWGVAPVVQPSGADQAAVTLGYVDGEFAGLTISDPPTQAEVQALRDVCEELADDVRNLSTLIHSLGAALVAEGVIKDGPRLCNSATAYQVGTSSMSPEGVNWVV